MVRVEGQMRPLPGVERVEERFVVDIFVGHPVSPRPNLVLSETAAVELYRRLGRLLRSRGAIKK